MSDEVVAKTFVALLEEAGIEQAAVRLGVDRSTVRRRIRELRERFSDETINDVIAAGGSQDDLSPRTQEIYERFCAGLNTIALTVAAHSATFDYRASCNSFTIASNQFATRMLLPQMFDEAERVNAKMLFSLSQVTDTTRARDIAESLRKGRYDIAMTEYKIQERGIAQIEVFTDRWVLVGNPDIFDAAVSLEDLVEDCYRHIRPTGDPIDAALKVRGLTRSVSVSGVSVLDVPYLAANSNMVGACPALCWAESPFRDQLRVHDIPLNIEPYAIYLSYKAAQEKGSELLYLINFVSKHAMRRAPGKVTLESMRRRQNR